MKNDKNSLTMKYDLEERTAQFGIEIIQFCKKMPSDFILKSLAFQLVKSGTSIGANYCEANDAESKKDFCHKIGICKKEAHETCHWLRMIASSFPNFKQEAQILWTEAKELTLIFNAIIRSSKQSL